MTASLMMIIIMRDVLINTGSSNNRQILRHFTIIWLLKSTHSREGFRHLSSTAYQSGYEPGLRQSHFLDGVEDVDGALGVHLLDDVIDGTQQSAHHHARP